jgi:probable 2-oxoglutarate dehydrogenase E1 component DHKTD1
LKKDQSYSLQGILHLPPSSASSTDGGDPPPRDETGEGTRTSRSLPDIRDHLMKTYVDRIGYEYMHCPIKDERLYVLFSILNTSSLVTSWFSHHVETGKSMYKTPFEGARKKQIWKLLARSEELDRFLGKKFPNLKRYGESCLEDMPNFRM